MKDNTKHKEIREKVASEETFVEKLNRGLALAYERMLEFKRYKKSKVVVMRDGKIVYLEP